MRLYKITALMYRDFLIMMNAKWRLVEMFYFPITGIIIWGFFAIYSKQFALEAGLLVLMVNVFWNFAQIAQSTVNIQLQEDVWSGSLKQVLLSGITEFEYIGARILSSTVVSLLLAVILTVLASAFGLDIFGHLGALLILMAITLVGSIALAIFIAAIVVAVGREYGFLAWSALQIFILLSAPFYPIEVFPRVLQYVAVVMPFTALFASARLLATGGFSPALALQSLLVVLVSFALSWPVYLLAFRRARRTGKLVKIY